MYVYVYIKRLFTFCLVIAMADGWWLIGDGWWLMAKCLLLPSKSLQPYIYIYINIAYWNGNVNIVWTRFQVIMLAENGNLDQNLVITLENYRLPLDSTCLASPVWPLTNDCQSPEAWLFNLYHRSLNKQYKKSWQFFEILIMDSLAPFVHWPEHMLVSVKHTFSLLVYNSAIIHTVQWNWSEEFLSYSVINNIPYDRTFGSFCFLFDCCLGLCLGTNRTLLVSLQSLWHPWCIGPWINHLPPVC